MRLIPYWCRAKSLELIFSHLWCVIHPLALFQSGSAYFLQDCEGCTAIASFKQGNRKDMRVMRQGEGGLTFRVSVNIGESKQLGHCQSFQIQMSTGLSTIFLTRGLDKQDNINDLSMQLTGNLVYV